MMGQEIQQFLLLNNTTGRFAKASAEFIIAHLRRGNVFKEEHKYISIHDALKVMKDGETFIIGPVTMIKIGRVIDMKW